jgi:hypothetical protein
MADRDNGPGDAKDAGSTGTGSLAAAADRLRDAARWLVISFGAVAAVVFAGIAVSRFGDLDPETSIKLFLLAAAAALAALVGALSALLIAVSLAGASSISLQQLLAGTKGATATAATAVAADPLLSPWDNDLKKFDEDLRKAHDGYQGELLSWRNDIDRGTEYVDKASVRLSELSRTQQEIQEAASFLRLQARFNQARWWIGGFLALAAVGAIAFAWATGREASESVPDETRTARWSVGPGVTDRVAHALGGEACGYDLTAVPVVILGTEGDGKEVDVVTVPTDGCAALRLVVASSDLKATPEALD